jgi:hypothetical protein
MSHRLASARFEKITRRYRDVEKCTGILRASRFFATPFAHAVATPALATPASALLYPTISDFGHQATVTAAAVDLLNLITYSTPPSIKGRSAIDENMKWVTAMIDSVKKREGDIDPTAAPISTLETILSALREEKSKDESWCTERENRHTEILWLLQVSMMIELQVQANQEEAEAAHHKKTLIEHITELHSFVFEGEHV